MIDPKPTTQPTTMNEKTKTTEPPEPLAAILAEMRASSLATVRDWADRIEAAAERVVAAFIHAAASENAARNQNRKETTK